MENTIDEIKILLPDAASGDLDALRRLDARGFLLGPNESPQDYVTRINTFIRHLEAMEESLTQNGRFKDGDVNVTANNRITQEIYDEAIDKCRELYGFTIKWVPGFYANLGPIFGGAAYSSCPDFFALFIISEKFRDRQRWFIYNRQELLAHELCHVARIALDSQDFEETFAYQTSDSTFRKLLGGLFLRQSDSFIFLASAFILLFAQILRQFMFSALPIWPFWLIFPAVCAWLALRYARLMKILSKCRARLNAIHDKHQARRILFHLSDDEIRTLASLENAQQAEQWLASQDSPRWQVILAPEVMDEEATPATQIDAPQTSCPVPEP